MAKPLRVLNVEDSKRDAALLMRHLTQGGYEVFPRRVQTEPAMTAALKAEKWDIVLCDYAMPRFDALGALAALRSSGLDIPFIIISGTVGEDIAVEAMLSGAHDYLSKDNLTRLVPAIERELKEAKNRNQLRWAGEERRVSENRYRTLFEHAPDGIVIADPAGTYIDANVSICKMLGFSRDEIIGRSGSDFVVDMHARDVKSAIDQIRSGAEYSHERQYRRKDGSIFTGEVTATAMPDGNVLGLIRDISERKDAQHLKQKLTARIEQQRNRLDTIVKSVPGIVWETSRDMHRTVESQDFVSGYVMTMLGYSVEEWLATPDIWLSIVHEDDRERVRLKAEAARIAGESSIDEFRWVRKDGQIIWVEARSAGITDDDGNHIGVRGVTIDVTERRRADDERRIIAEIGQGAVTTPNLDEYLKLVHSSIGQIVYAENCFVMLYDPETDTEHFEFWVDKYDPHPAPGPSGKGFTNYVLRTSKPLLLTSEVNKQLIDAGEVELIGEPSPCWLGVPLRTPERTVGVLVLQHYEDEKAYSLLDLDFIASVGDHIALAIERKRGEQAIQESEQRFSNAFEHAPIGVALVSPEGQWLKANRVLCEMVGYTEAEFLSLTFQEITYPEDLDADIENVRRMLAGEISSYQMEKRYFHKDGHLVSALLSVSLVRDLDGVPQYFISQIQDITERKSAERQLQLHSLLLNSIGQAVVVTDGVGTITYWNNFAEKMYGWTSSEAIGLSILDVTPAEATRQQGKDILNALKRGESWSGEYVVQKRDGTPFPVFVTNTPLINAEGKVESIIGISLDVTERKQAEEKLRENESLLSSTQRIAHIGSWVIESSDSGTMETAREFWSDEHYRIYGFEPGQIEITDEVFYNSVHPDDRERVRDAVERKEPFDIEHRIIRPDGTERVVQAIAEVVRDGQSGKVLKLRGSVQDITERKCAEEALRASESRLRTIIDTEPECVKLIDRDGSLLEMNPAGLRMIEADSFEQVANQSVFGLIVEEDRKAFRDLTERVFEGESGTLEFQLVGHKGTRRWMDTHANPLRDASGEITALLAITRDVSERKLGETARLASERKYQDLVTLAPVGIYQSRPDGSFITANAALANMLGYDSADELLTKNFADFYFNPEERGELFDKYEGRGFVTDINLQWTRKDGLPIWIQLTGHAIKRPDGATEYLEGFVRDITKQRSVEENLRESDEKFHQLADHISDVFWIRSPDMSKIYYISPAYEQIWGRKLKSDYADPHEWYEFIFPPDRQRVKEAYAGLMNDRPEIEVEFRILRPDGGQRWVRARGFQVKDSGGEVIRLAGIVTDITEKRHAEAALMDSEFRYHSLFENMLEGYAYCETIFEGDELRDFIYTEVNGAFEQLTGLSNVVGRKVSEAIPGIRESSPELFEIYGRVALTGEPEKFETYVESLEIWLCITVYSSARENFVVVFDNISNRKRAEASLVESQEQLTLATESASIGIWDWDLVEDTMKWDARMYDLYGNHDEDFSGPSETWNLNIHPDDVERIYAEYAEAIEEANDFHSEFCVVWPNGEVRHLESSAKVLRDKNGRALRFIGVNWDITERKVAEETLREADQRAIREYGLLLTRVSKLALALGDARDLDTVFEELHEFALVSTGMDGLIISLYDAKQNARTAAYVWSEGVKVDASTLPPMVMSDSPHSRSVLTGEMIITDDYQSAMEGQPVLHLSGDLPRSSLVVPMSVMGNIVGGVEVQSNDLAAFHDNHATAMQMAANLAANAIENVRLLDIERLQAEQLRQGQKMEAVGVLAGGIAHDFNNLLTAINGYSALTLRGMSIEDPLRRNIEEVKKAGDRAADLTSQLLAFSRKQVLNPIVHNLNSVITNIEKMLRRIIKENIELRTVLDPNLGNVKADTGQLEQVIMNLAINARDAMLKGGTLTIETSNVYLDQEYASSHLNITPGAFVKMTVTDTGIGIAKDTKQHIFEPFFTTKEVGKGTGLGLSTVYGIIKQSGGDIMVYSEIGRGSAFKIYLPCVDENVHIAKWKDEPGADLSGTETILLVEDEEMVRNLVVEILTSSGYKVLTAVSGQDGLSLFKELTEPVHLLLTDVIMPSMGGAELRDRIVALRPDIKVLFMSGYSDEAISSKGVLDADSAFIEKPFNPEDLVRKVREVLEA